MYNPPRPPSLDNYWRSLIFFGIIKKRTGLYNIGRTFTPVSLCIGDHIKMESLRGDNYAMSPFLLVWREYNNGEFSEETLVSKTRQNAYRYALIGFTN
jgi:hypothetical protein